MSYRLNAAVGPFDLLRSVVPEEVRPSVVPLRQRMGFVPFPSWLVSQSRGAYPEEAMAEWSHAALIGQVEVDFSGGDGDQTASLWRDGRRIWGPSYTRDFTGPRHEWPVNAVLARLGVVVESGHLDLFDEVGFGDEREHEDWRPYSLEARQYATWDDWNTAREAERAAERAAAERVAAERAVYSRLPGVPVPLTGADVMRILGIPPGREVGAAIRFLQNLHVERGGLSPEDAATALRSWHRR
ncbi:hypothetical protein [Actinoplanes sp. NBRC 101535]|uniref:hypothetical protein n=1 Tax=Actinoplanes sp. NBRC 101535 TaxID=3032196 RepID=UPI0024A2F7F8|nr:hypothetical protein [Actinoplanes sp. NBRC 101535]GLY07824.1 hypothetical protein Acsp01_82030 [Actinoplanes sp. NBRC 101535]